MITLATPLARRAPAVRPQQGIVLLFVLVFLLLASLLSLGDLRTVVTQQRMVTTQFDAGSEFAYTESGLNFLESYAARELASISASAAFKGGNVAAPSNKICASVNDSDQACVAATCSSSSYIDPNHSQCSYCMRPSPVCKDRLSETDKTHLPWSRITILFKRTDRSGTPESFDYLGYFESYMEYLGMAPCNFSAGSPTTTNLGTYSNAVCPGVPLADGTPRCAPTTSNTCPVMRVTISNVPNNPLQSRVTLQSTVIGADPSNPTGFPGRRIAFRQVLPP